MIKMQVGSELCTPVFFCDQCGEVIDDHRKANLVYENVDARLTECYHVHKFPCDVEFKKKFPERTLWQPLRESLGLLARGVGLELAKSN